MFGYVKAYIPELKVKEYELYRAAYCGVCKSMGKCTGCASRMALTWDSVFLFFLRTALTRESFQIKKGTCIAHPFKKRPYAASSSELSFCARATAVLTYYKLLDDLDDESGYKRFFSRILLPTAKRAKKRAELQPFEERCVSLLSELRDIEKANTPSFDAPADVSARLTAELFAYGFEKDSKEARLLYEIGYRTGKFIYAADAADDFYDDAKKGRYNPYLAMLGKPSLDESGKAMIRDAVRCEADRVLNALDLIDFEGNDGIKAILYNIACFGMQYRTENILNPKNKKERKTDERPL